MSGKFSTGFPYIRFLGLGIGDDIPDAKTIWDFRERLKELGLTEKFFARFDGHLNRSGFDAIRLSLSPMHP